MKNIFFYETDIGRIGIAEDGIQITNVFFESDLCPLNKQSSSDSDIVQKSLGDEFYLSETVLLKHAGKQLCEYLNGSRQKFSVPLAPFGTAFMRSVWNCLCEIPYGKTRSYKEIAEAVGNPKACRAVGLANNTNPIPIFIPCHRVIGANGKLTGYRGGLEIKQQLLELEKRYGNI